jgi:hypothetical protein
MVFKSETFKGDRKLEACAAYDSAHIKLERPNVHGEHIAKIQNALTTLIPLQRIAQQELDQKRFGPSTEEAVYQYKKSRNIINLSYQRAPDKIVGKMTIRALDEELVHRIGPIDPGDVFLPPLREEIPGFSVRASDGTIIDLPSRVGRPFDIIDLDGDRVDTFIESDVNGKKIYCVVIQHNTQNPGPVRKLAPAAAGAVAKIAAKTAIADLPKAVGFVLKWGVGKLVGGLVSSVAGLLDPTVGGKDIVWTVKLSDTKLVKYVVVTF